MGGPMDDYVRWFSDISSEDIASVGGKGANLGELTGSGFNVPLGFCITVSAYWDFLGEDKKRVFDIIDSLDHMDPGDLQKKSMQVQEIIVQQVFPPSLKVQIEAAYERLSESGKCPVAIRSSATSEDLPNFSFAGQHETFLNVKKEQLMEKVKRCWASLWTPRAIRYREKQGFDHKTVGMCLVVQKMIFSRLSGVMFTYNSLKGNENEIVIESTFGLGEGLVSGEVTPDSFVLDKKEMRILESKISEKKQMIIAEGEGVSVKEIPFEERNNETLSMEQIVKLAKLGLRIEKHFGSPQDIEWCIMDDEIFILQSRPVTDTERIVPKIPDDIIRNLVGEWTKSPLDERVQEPLTPFTWSIARESVPSFFQALRAFGFKFPEEEKMVKLFYGRPYVSKTELEKIFHTMPGVVDDFLMGGQAQLDRGNLKFSFFMIPMGIRALVWVNQVHKDWDREYPRILSEFAELKKFDSRSATPKELVEKLDHILGLAHSIAAIHALSIIFCEALYQFLVMFVSRYIEEDPNILCPKLVAGLSENRTLEANKNLWMLAEKAKANDNILSHVRSEDYRTMRKALNQTSEGKKYLAEFHKFLAAYGHRSPKYDLIYPSWGDDPDLVLKLVSSYLTSDVSQNPLLAEKRAIADRKKATALVYKGMRKGFFGRVFPVNRIMFKKLLFLSQKYMELRENQQFYIGQGYPIARKVVLELGNRFVKQGILEDQMDVFFLNADEIRDIVNGKDSREIKDKIESRRTDFEAFKKIEPPAIITKEGERNWEIKEVLSGIGGSPGMVSGRVKVISNIHEFGKFQEGDILVAPTTNPSWTPLFMMAKAVVTEVGGMLSHGAVVAREYQIPCVLGVRGATSVLKDGELITVDGAKGVIYTKENHST
jgi:pyruvate,water dikinase